MSEDPMQYGGVNHVAWSSRSARSPIDAGALNNPRRPESIKASSAVSACAPAMSTPQ